MTKLLLQNETILAEGIIEDLGDSIRVQYFGGQYASYPKHIIQGWQIVENVTLPNDFSLNKYKYVNGAFVKLAREESVLNPIRESIWGRVKELRERKINGKGAGVLVDGVWFHADQPFREAIAQAMRLYTIDELDDENSLKQAVATQLEALKTSQWRTMANTFVPVSRLLAVKIDIAHALLTQACHVQSHSLRNQLWASVEPENINIEEEWPQTYQS
jgi:hypothetical protein